MTEDAVCILIFYAQSGLKCFFFLLVPFFRRWQDGARFEEFMARHAEESRDDLQAMKSLNVFYQVRPDFCTINVFVMTVHANKIYGNSISALRFQF